ncbi:MAG: UDP-N-acetylmuramate--L-alanine ligase [Armatimonadetes bacterium]|nr:UDP-N-acetylmuramate--L-alanine ligase [Armatimonadota bacterium]
MELAPGQHVFFAGIGGISMSGLAHALLDMGFPVSGSDMSESPALDHLRQAGAKVFVGHDAANIAGADLLVRTTAVLDDSPEIRAARDAGIPIHHRSELLAWMCRDRVSIGITGTHGKSTTTAMAATILLELGLDPMVFVGAESPRLGGNYRLGKGKHIVFEACESDRSFLNYVGCSQVITSVEADHLDNYKTFDAVKDAFAQFAGIADPNGFIVYNADASDVRDVVSNAPARLISYGLATGAKLSATDIQMGPTGSLFELLIDGQRAGQVHIKPVGEHNVRNALAALGVALGCGLDMDAARAALANYEPIGRRFQHIGSKNGLCVVDDYAHHPTELRAVLAAARSVHSGRIIAVFQPHLRSRTRDLLHEFGASFANADLVVLTDIYQPREDGLAEFDITNLVRAIEDAEPGKEVSLVRNMADVPGYLAPLLSGDDLVLTIGAGDIVKIGPAILAAAH